MQESEELYKGAARFSQRALGKRWYHMCTYICMYRDRHLYSMCILRLRGWYRGTYSYRCVVRAAVAALTCAYTAYVTSATRAMSRCFASTARRRWRSGEAASCCCSSPTLLLQEKREGARASEQRKYVSERSSRISCSRTLRLLRNVL